MLYQSKPRIPWRIGICLVLGTLAGCSSIISHSQSGHESEVYAKRSLGTALDDNAIVGKTEAKLRALNEQFAAMVQVDSYNKIVLLTGRVPDKGFINKAITVASKIPGVREVHSEITQGAPTTISNYWYDAWLTTKVKSQLTLTSNAPSSKTKVRSFAGHIYLMGVMTEQEAKNAIYIASRIPGAKKVVSMIETVDGEGHATVAAGKKPEPQRAKTPVKSPRAEPPATPEFTPVILDSAQAPASSNRSQVREPTYVDKAEGPSSEASAGGFSNDYPPENEVQPRSVPGR